LDPLVYVHRHPGLRHERNRTFFQIQSRPLGRLIMSPAKAQVISRGFFAAHLLLLWTSLLKTHKALNSLYTDQVDFVFFCLWLTLFIFSLIPLFFTAEPFEKKLASFAKIFAVYLFISLPMTILVCGLYIKLVTGAT
jgi:hypothetical protein